MNCLKSIYCTLFTSFILFVATGCAEDGSTEQKSAVKDALGTDRVYKKAWEMERIIEYFKSEIGSHFDPILVDLFLENINEFIMIREAFQETGQGDSVPKNL